MTRTAPLPSVTDPQDQSVELHRAQAVDQPDPGEILAELAAQAAREAADGAAPTPFAAGTFAFYAAPDGSIVTVFDLAESSRIGTPGVNRVKIPQGIIRATTVLMSGGSKFDAVRALMGRGR